MTIYKHVVAGLGLLSLTSMQSCGDNTQLVLDAESATDGRIVSDGSLAIDASTTPDALVLPRLRINEVVVSPTHDWSGATPSFGGIAGSGMISPDDEYVELFNADSAAVDLRDWVLRMKDSEIKDTRIGSQGTLVFSAGSTIDNLLPGGYLVIGNPTGASATDVFVSLRTASGAVVDDVEIGGLTASRDTEGDGVADGAPTADSNGFSRGAFDEAIARSTGSDDSDNDIVDFIATYATPGRSNATSVPVPETVAPTLVSTSTGVARAISAPISISFSESIDASSVDAIGAMTATTGMFNINLGLATFADDDNTIILNPVGVYPFGATISVTLRGGASGIKDRLGNPLAADVRFTVTMETAPIEPSAVRINEVCATPLQDWNDTAGGNQTAFDAIAGTGSVNSDDEWIELLNTAAGTTNLSNYTLTTYAGPTLLQDARLTTRLTSSNTRVFGTGTLSASKTGDRIVLGNPAGAIPASVFLELRSGSGALIDHVEIGGAFPSNDRGGNGINNGAPAAGQDGNSTGPLNETVSRLPNADTGNAVADWDHAAASIGVEN